MMNTLNRATIGLRLPQANLDELEHALLLIRRKPGIHDVRWSQPGEWIIPLMSLGEVSIATLSSVSTVLKPFAESINHFSASFSGFSGLPNLIQPRYVTLEFDEVYSGALNRLATAIEAKVSPLLPPREIKIIQTHITLGRLKTESEPLRVALGRALKIPDQPVLSPILVDRLELLVAHATTSGMSYKLIESFPMK